MLLPLHSNPTPFDLEHRLYSKSPKPLPQPPKKWAKPPTFLSSIFDLYNHASIDLDLQLLFMCGVYEAHHSHSDEVGFDENL